MGKLFLKERFAVKGNLRIDENLKEKRIRVDQLLVGPGGKVMSVITATNVVIEGIVIGNITASTRILLLSTAGSSATSEILKLIIQDGVSARGQMHISRMELDNTRDYIENFTRGEHPVTGSRKKIFITSYLLFFDFIPGASFCRGFSF
jgi:cytoskeletal protein CcmA (bactofilin family)